MHVSPGSKEDKVWGFGVDGFDDKLSVIEGNISNLRPGETNFWGQFVVLFVDVQAEGVHSQPEVRALLVLDVKVVNSVHFKILGDLQVLHHGVFSQHTTMLRVPVGGPLLPLFPAELVLLHHTFGKESIVCKESGSVEILLDPEIYENR